MTQEDKELLLADLCGRLPYGVRARVLDVNDTCVLGITKRSSLINDIRYTDVITNVGNYKVEDVKPYLRSISSMTEEERKEYYNLCEICVGYDGKYSQIKIFDWLNKKMFDYRGLIEKGLALEAPDMMYEI